MGIIYLICFIIGIVSCCYLIGIIFNKIKSIIKKEKFKIELSFPFDYYKEKPLVFLVLGLIIIVLTIFTMSSAILSIIFPNDLRYKPEGDYCYYVLDKDNKAYPAKIEKTSYEEDSGEDYYGNKKTDTYVSVNLLELYIDNESYEFYDDPQEINTGEFSNVLYIDENLEEKNFSIKLTNDIAYCPSFGKGTTKTDYLELIFEILVIISEITMYFITICVFYKEKNK